MIDPESMAQLRKELRERMVEDRKLLEELHAGAIGHYLTQLGARDVAALFEGEGSAQG